MLKSTEYPNADFKVSLNYDQHINSMVFLYIKVIQLPFLKPE